MDNFAEYNEKCVQLYHAIHEYAAAGYSKRAIAKELRCSRNTVTKYLYGDYESLCRRNYRSGMDQFYDFIIKELSAGISRKDVLYISDKLTILHGQSDHLSRRFRSLISERYGR